MQQVQKARNRLNTQAQWIQLGLLSASILAPLVNRWNELHAMERTRAPSPSSHQTSQQPAEEVALQGITATEHHRASRSSTILWTAGVGVGIIAAGIGAYVLVKRRMASYHGEPLLPLPFHKPDKEPASDLAIPGDLPHGSTISSMDGLHTRSWSATDSAPYTHQAVAKLAHERSDSSSMAEVEPTATVVGNIRTMAYHLSGDDKLPDEDNRIYFSSEEEARLAGYHLHSQTPSE